MNHMHLLQVAMYRCFFFFLVAFLVIKTIVQLTKTTKELNNDANTTKKQHIITISVYWTNH